MTDCDHPRSEVTIADTASDIEVGNAVPKFWTIQGFCSQCQEPVEIDYEFMNIMS